MELERDEQRGSEYAVSVDEAMTQLSVIPDYDPGDGPKPCVHTFRASAIGLLGAHWSLEQVRAAMEKHGIEEAGPNMAEMGHALVFTDDTGPVFLETRREVARS